MGHYASEIGWSQEAIARDWEARRKYDDERNRIACTAVLEWLQGADCPDVFKVCEAQVALSPIVHSWEVAPALWFHLAKGNVLLRSD